MIFARRPLLAGNWKMHGTRANLGRIELVARGYDAGLREKIDMLLCLPATLIALAAPVASGGLALGGQDCHSKQEGAHTGDISAAMLADAGASFVIVGHSERRADHGETDSVIRAKASAALQAGLTPIVCVGETRAERDPARRGCGGAQIAGSVPNDAPAGGLVLAYEPVWAIGTA